MIPLWPTFIGGLRRARMDLINNLSLGFGVAFTLSRTCSMPSSARCSAR